jgi:type II restriction enzyme
MDRPYLQHMKSSDDLVTTYEAVRAGFVALTLERNRRATPFVEQARALQAAAAKAAIPDDLFRIEGIQPALLTAAGVSDKAAGYLQPHNKREAIQGLLRNFLEPAGAAFVEELVFRFLLTRGDTLGGSMRNVGGILAQRKLSRTLLSTLALADTPYQWLNSTTNTWARMTDEDADIELYLRGLNWQKGEKQRTLIYNLTVPIVENNVDLCLLDCGAEERSAAIYSPELFLALGELKGGIDPAGAAYTTGFLP